MDSTYTVKGIKSFKGMEGLGFNATLYRDGRKVAFVTDEARGGCFRYDWVDEAEEALLDAYVKTQPPVECDVARHWGMSMDTDLFLAILVSEAETQTKMKRVARKQTLFRVKGDKPGEYRTLSRPYDNQTKAYLAKVYGDHLEEVFNEKA